MIVYADSSLVARWMLEDEDGHAEARRLLAAHDVVPVTGGWTRIEVTGALVRAARAGRISGDDGHHERLRNALGPEGPFITVAPAQGSVEVLALRLARAHGVRAMDAWHLAVAAIVLPQLARDQEPVAFATRDDEQAAVAVSIGLSTV